MGTYRKPTADVFSESREDRNARQQLSYEERVVQYLLTRYQLPSAVKYEMLAESLEATGERRLTLTAFHDKFPTFPMRLFAERFDHVVEAATVAKIYSDFARLPFTKALALRMDELAEQGESTHIGLVFYWPYLRGHVTTQGKVKAKQGPIREPGGMMGLVVHNRPPDLAVPGVRNIWTAPTKQLLVLEPLNVLLQAIDRAATGSRHKHWQP